MKMSSLFTRKFDFVTNLLVVFLSLVSLNGCVSSKIDKNVTLQFGEINKMNMVRYCNFYLNLSNCTSNGFMKIDNPYEKCIFSRVLHRVITRV